jgi:hypothetical protein
MLQKDHFVKPPFENFVLLYLQIYKKRMKYEISYLKNMLKGEKDENDFMLSGNTSLAMIIIPA